VAAGAPRADAPGPVVFFGSPLFAVPTLEALVDSGWRPDLVVSPPARPAGRGQRERQPAVAAWAIEHGLPLSQPPRVKASEFLERMKELQPWVAVVVAFGQIFPQSLLDIPTVGCVNLHGSLLPKYRGAAPIHAAIAAGDRVTGVTTMQMERGLDSGPMLLERSIEIGVDETTPDLSGRLSTLGAQLMVETLDALAAGAIEARPQNDALATRASMIRKEDGRVDWASPAGRLRDLWRAYNPWPGLTAELAGERVKLIELARVDPNESSDADPGTFLGVGGDELRIACGEGTILRVVRLQRPNRRAVTANDFVNGEQLVGGERFS